MLDLKSSHNIQFSFNDKLLGKCLVTDTNSYTTVEHAIASWIKNCSLSYRIEKEVFIVYKEKTRRKAGKTNTFNFKVQILGKDNKEPLPFSSVQINASGLITDVNGNFSFKAKDSLLEIGISHLGYYSLDTIVAPHSCTSIELIPKVIGLQEVTIQSGPKDSISYIPAQAGFQKINHKSVSFLPGNNNNTLFNVLRLQPGVLAAGEQTNDFIIWGSYKGETQILLDGITLFNTSSFNEHIGAVNPLIIKDIEIHKGGYNVHLGDRVGGLVNITSKSGYQSGFHALFNINNQTASGMFSFPVSGRSSLQAAFRKTYYNKLGVQQKEPKEDYNTNFNFGDINCKYSGYTKNGDTYYLSIIGSDDTFTEKLNKDEKNITYLADTWQERTQLGGSFFYGKKWENGGLTNTTLAYSSLESSFFNYSEFDNSQKSIDSSSYNSTTNGISELSLKWEHCLPTNKTHGVRIGGGIIQNTSTFSQDSTKQTLKYTAADITRLNAYMIDKISLSKFISLEPGIRIDLPVNEGNPYIQPRIGIHFTATSKLKFNLRYGIYHQFVTENTIVDNFNNYLYYWGITDNKYLPVLKGTHYVAGMLYDNKFFDLRLEGFYKKTDGLHRYYQPEKLETIAGSIGRSRSYGVDCYLNKEIKKHDFSIAYTWSRTEEHFDHFTNEEYQRAAHDQRHELKGAGLFNFNPFFFSLNYTYGSGVSNVSDLNSNLNLPVYSRLDIALLYKFRSKKIKSEAGISILNLLNHENVRYNNFSSFPDSESAYSPATPFTPLLFLNIGI